MFGKLAVTVLAATALGCAGLASESASAANVWRPHGGGGGGGFHNFGGGGFHNFGGGAFRNFGGGFAHFGGVRRFAYHAPLQHFAYHAPLQHFAYHAPLQRYTGHVAQRYATGGNLPGAYAPHGVARSAPQSPAWRQANAEWRDHNGFDHHRHGWFPGRRFHPYDVGWAGQVFWPYAYDDLFDYAFYPYDDDDYSYLFWDYGYDDLFAGILLPYTYVGMSSYDGAPPVESTARAPGYATAAQGYAGAASSPEQACVSAESLSGGVSVEQIADAVRPTGDQNAKLDALKTAEQNAQKSLAASCAVQVPTTADGRLNAVATRLQAMIKATDIVRGPLDAFYSSLNDQQKAEFNILGAKTPTKAALGTPASLEQLCGPQNAVPVVATDQIDKAIEPDAKQQADLVALSAAANKADQEILASCPSQAPLTPPARLDAVHARLQAMLNGVNLVRPAFQAFYASLSGAQQASLNTLTQPPSPPAASAANPPAAAQSAAAEPAAKQP